MTTFPLAALATTVVSKALGSYAGSTYWGPQNDIETLIFLGVTVVTLAADAFVGSRRAQLPRGVRGWVRQRITD